MHVIINLSSIHTLHPESKSIEAFANLCDKYSTGNLSSSSSNFFQPPSNYNWVTDQYQTKYKELIEPYKLGKINTDQFLQNLATIFSFLDESKLKDNDLTTITQESAGSYTTDPKLALLAEAWNAIIGLDETIISRFSSLAQSSYPVYLISNTNELNVLAILALLKKHNPNINFKASIDLSVKEDKTPIEIAPNTFLCLSYRYQLFKTSAQNEQTNPHSTMSLLKYLIEEQLNSPSSEVSVISQYDEDLTEARKLGIEENNIHKSDLFFSTDEPESRKTIS